MDTFNLEFLESMRALLGEEDLAAYIAAMHGSPRRLARVNPLKRVPDELLRAELKHFPYLRVADTPGKSPLHAAGAYYVQEPSAAAVSALIAPLLPPNALVLDMCASPGGKVTHAAATRPDCTFLANETVFSRSRPLLQNVERLGIRNVTVTSLRPDVLAEYGHGLFDAVLADVPCSGEGMFRKSEAARKNWSASEVDACARRAEKILESCDLCLKTGGVLLFSTCTLNRTENEEQAAKLIAKGYEPIEPPERPDKSRTGFGLPQAVRFFPQDGGGEGHFACLFRKTADTPRPARTPALQKSNRAKKVLDALSFVTTERFSGIIAENGNGFELVSEDYPFAAFPALRRGVRLADNGGSVFIPHHHFAMAAHPDELIDSPSLTPSDPKTRAYLRGESFPLDSKPGFRVLRVGGITLGLIKVTGGIAKNHYPKGLRIID